MSQCNHQVCVEFLLCVPAPTVSGPLVRQKGDLVCQTSCHRYTQVTDCDPELKIRVHGEYF